MNLERHFRAASDFLIGCQVIEPYVLEGTLRGCVCPWEIGTHDREGFTILEDFHDTLEAIWVWCYYTKLSGKETFEPNIQKGWDYVDANWKRFIPLNQKTEGLYDCSHVVLNCALHEKVFADKSHRSLFDFAAKRLADYLSKTRSPAGKEYFDPWWMAASLAQASHLWNQQNLFEAAANFVKHCLVEKTIPFSKVEKEPSYRGAGGHNFFSINANKVLALLSCFSSEAFAQRIVIEKFLHLAPKQFIERRTDENAWNANVAAALGKCYLSTSHKEFIRRYFAIMSDLEARASDSALPRSKKFPIRESWVTFFYAYAYASVFSELDAE